MFNGFAFFDVISNLECMQNNNESVSFKRNSDLVYRIDGTILAVGGDRFSEHSYGDTDTY